MIVASRRRRIAFPRRGRHVSKSACCRDRFQRSTVAQAFVLEIGADVILGAQPAASPY